MARPEYCPVLSTPPVFDEQSRSLKSSMLVKCKGEACALYRKKDDSCALGGVEPGSSTTAIATPVADEDDAMMEAMERLESLVAGRDEGLDDKLEELRRDVRKDSHRFEEALADIVQSLNRVSGAMEGFTRSSRSFERLHERLQRETRVAEDRAEAEKLYRQGVEHLAAGRIADGNRSLRSCLAKGDAAPRAAVGALGAGLLLGGEIADAIVNLRRAAREDDCSPAPHANLAHAQALSGDWAAAEASAREAVRIDPRCAAAWNTLGNALFESGKPPEAVAAWQKAVEADPGLEAAWANLSRQRLVSCAEPEEN